MAGAGRVRLLLLAIARCSPSGGGPDAEVGAAAVNAQTAIVAAVDAQSPPAPRKLSRTAVSQGLRHVPLARREGPAGEMIYSQNCYNALGRKFSWSKLDACGAFDAEAALAVEDAEGASDQPTEAAWFQSEAAAGRFLKAAVAAGQRADEADVRWSDLQAKVASRHRPARLRPDTPPDPPADEAPIETDDVLGNAGA